LVFLIIFGKEYKWSSSLCRFSNPFPLYLISVQYCFSILFSNTLNLCRPLISETKFSVHKQPKKKNYSLAYYIS
jgi:hypothetical protein